MSAVQLCVRMINLGKTAVLPWLSYCWQMFSEDHVLEKCSVLQHFGILLRSVSMVSSFTHPAGVTPVVLWESKLCSLSSFQGNSRFIKSYWLF